jgi:hypothetical protein
VYKFNSAETIASFSGGEQLDEWAEALNRIVSGQRLLRTENREQKTEKITA